MNNIKIITLFHTNRKIPFMTCIVKDVEENEQVIKLTLQNSDNIHVKDYDYFFLSESAHECDQERMINTYRRLISELSQVSEETIESLVPKISNNMKTNFPASGVSALEDD
ncbi:TPA: hypothetical protein O8T86_004478 [Enterobacter asburiae]|jgi:hypothetical protein|uniref:hypothetical protein n=1 Tax=Enterobacteriaceae TaxID=543 RepID=UPI000C762264|nr:MULTISPECIES: hypothetical protein [Enterobacteriaceae]EKW7743304.1 hypothetical protein [Enterobacter roggenkampii]HDC4565563.1 hypothetical protein [Enterobacter asburiae]EJT9391067.1 hypothetical protein [Escherichia coli]EKM0792353.1 hypothetical protein [Escherichia coli]EKX8766744.1 hypothetical protein [Citrobacter koseri]